MSQPLFENIELPAMPQVMSRIMDIDESDMDISFDQLTTLITADPNLVSKIIKLANSPFYSRVNNISDLNQALKLLGFKSIKSLTLLISVSELIPNMKQNTNVQRELWLRSIIKAVIARTVAAKTGNRPMQEHAFMAALLRNIGQLFLHSRFPGVYEKLFRATKAGTEIQDLFIEEKDTFSISSPEMTVHTMKKWNLPEELVQAAERGIDDVTESENDSTVGIIACFSEVILFRNRYTEMIPERKETFDYFDGLFDEYCNLLQLDDAKKKFFSNDIGKAFESDDLYTFCEELFSS
ncbi:MAG: HDOD domain-containing protein [Leptospirales bacterium]